jgi:hypothetical protein
MARDRANIRIDMWADTDWRNLSAPAQWLYMLLLTSPTLSYAGVADWRPNRVAQLSRDASTQAIRDAATELEAAAFVFVDDETEEVVIRSFVKHDGLLKSPNLASALGNAYAAIYSQRIREIVAFEVQKLHARDPSLKGWERVPTLLHEPAVELLPNPSGNPSVKGSVNPSVNPSGNPKPNPSGNPSVNPSPTATATTTSNKLEGHGRKRPARALPDSWTPNERHRSKAKELSLNLDSEAERFRNHAQANDRKQANWDAAFNNWLLKSKDFGGGTQGTLVDPETDRDRRLNPWKYQ